MKLIIIDNRPSVIRKCKDAGIKAILGDYFIEALKVPRHVLCTASNPSFTMAGGIDKQFDYHFPLYCDEARRSRGKNQRIGNICFSITVDDTFRATEELVREAVRFAFANTGRFETLCMCALGTSIGGLKEEVFMKVLQEELGGKNIL